MREKYYILYFSRFIIFLYTRPKARKKMALSLFSREEEKSRTSLIYQIKMCSLIILAMAKMLIIL